MKPRLVLSAVLFAAIAALAVGSALILAFNDPTPPSLHAFELFPCEATQPGLSLFGQDGSRAAAGK